MKVMPIDKNTKRGFTDVETPQDKRYELLKGLAEQVRECKSVATNTHLRIQELKKEAGNDREIKSLGKLYFSNGKKLQELKKRVTSNKERNQILISKLRSCVSNEVFLDCAKRTEREVNDINEMLNGVYEDEFNNR